VKKHPHAHTEDSAEQPQPLPAALTFTTPPPPVAPAPQIPQELSEAVTLHDIGDKLDDILTVMHRRERRERWRMIVANLRSFVWFAFLVGSTWYVYAYGDELMATIADQAAKSAARATSQGSAAFMDQLPDEIKEMLQR
jgi:hypothetical protein